MSGTVTYGAASVLTWDAWFRLMGLAEIRLTPCRRCEARRSEPCLARTGITASVPCAVRVADAGQGTAAAA